MIYSIYSIGKQGETAPPGSRKATFAAFSASAGGSQPSPCGLANKRIQWLNGVEIELPDDGIDESAADAGEEK